MRLEKPANAAPEVYWEGLSGVEYGYWVFEIGTEFVDRARPGNFIYAKLTRLHQWLPVYIGHTDNLMERLSDRDEIESMRRHGATHLHAHPSFRPAWIRENEEVDLIRRWLPVCNRSFG